MASGGQQDLPLPDPWINNENDHTQPDQNQHGSASNTNDLDHIQQALNNQDANQPSPCNDFFNDALSIGCFDLGSIPAYNSDLYDILNDSTLTGGPTQQGNNPPDMYTSSDANLYDPRPSTYTGGPITINNQHDWSVASTPGLGAWNSAVPSTYIPETPNGRTAESSTYQNTPVDTSGSEPYMPNVIGDFGHWLAGAMDGVNDEALNHKLLASARQPATSEDLDLSQYTCQQAGPASPFVQSLKHQYGSQSGEAGENNEEPVQDARSDQGHASLHDFSEENESERESVEGSSNSRAQSTAGLPSQGTSAPEFPQTKQTRSRKGVTRQINGRLEWWDRSNKSWRAAVIHHNIRSKLQRLAQQAHPGASYDHPDPNQGDVFNDTSFFLPHQTWGAERGARPGIVWRWEKGDESELPADQGEPGWMVYKGKIVLDPHDNPIKDFWNVPVVLSPWTEGFKLEAMSRENARISHTDFWARMPRSYRDQKGRTTLGTPNARVNMPMGRFRLKAGCQSWSSPRDGTHGITAGLLEFYAGHDFDPVSGNSTRNFGRDLYTWERDQVKLKNVGQFGSRAGRRAVDQATRAQRLQEKTRKINEKQAASKIRGHSRDQTVAGSIPGATASRRGSFDIAGSGSSQQAQPDAAANDLHSCNPGHESPSREDDQVAVSNDDSNKSGSQNGAQYPVLGNDMLVTPFTSLESSPEGHDLASSFLNPPSSQSKRKRNAWGDNGIEQTEDASILSKHRHTSPRSRASTKGPEQHSRNASPQKPAQELHKEFAASGSEAKKDQTDTQGMGFSRKLKRNILDVNDTEVEQSDNTIRSPKCRVALPAVSPSRAPTAQTFKQIVPSTANLARPQQRNPQHRSSNLILLHRTTAPDSDAERKILDDALAPSIEAYFEWTAHEAPLRDRNTSYVEQYEQLHLNFEFDWAMQSNEPVPQLVGLPALGNSNVVRWTPLLKDEEYYAAWRFGHRAPRTVDGVVIDVPGHLLERLAKEGSRRALLLEGLMLGFGWAPSGEFWQEIS